MTFGAETWGPPLISAAGSALGGYLGGQSDKETKMQKTQRKLVDQLLSSLQGSGPYSSLFDSSDDTFQKSFVQPALSKFRNQVAPEIQQQYIQSGQQRGTSLDDQLLRAGVDLDSLLNANLANFQQNAMNRQQHTIGNILGGGAGALPAPSGGQNALAGLGGYFGSEDFGKAASGLFKQPPNTDQLQGASGQVSQRPITPTRPGFKPDWMDYRLNDARWGQ